MKTKLLAVLFLAGSSLFAGPRVFVGFGFGGYGPRYYAPPPVVYAAPYAAPYYDPYYYGPRYVYRPRAYFYGGPRYYGPRYYPRARYYRR